MCEGTTFFVDHQRVLLAIMIVKILGDLFLLSVLLSYAAISHDALCSICVRLLISLVNDVKLFMAMMITRKNRFV